LSTKHSLFKQSLFGILHFILAVKYKKKKGGNIIHWYLDPKIYVYDLVWFVFKLSYDIG
jgi:hypothetical protein